MPDMTRKICVACWLAVVLTMFIPSPVAHTVGPALLGVALILTVYVLIASRKRKV